MFKSYISILYNFGISIKIPSDYATMFAEGIAFVSLIILSILAYFFINYIVRKTVYAFIHHSTNKYDDLVLKNKVISRICYLIPAFIIKKYVSEVMPTFPKMFAFVQETVEIYEIFVITIILTAIISTLYDFYNTFEMSKSKPIKGLVQVLNITLYVLSFLLIIATLIGKDISNILLGLGTASAILMLVFKDTILGFVASIQLSINNMIQIGDWIVMDKYQADGNVLEITLTTVKVQNWDNTITTIPTYSMISDSFINWRGMSESGGRRIKRHIKIDMETVKFCTPEMLERFKKFQLITNYITETEKNIQKFNQANKIDTSIIANGKQQTNLGIFRAYLREYLKSNSNINQNMTFIVRQLQPTEKGIPIEIYVFSRNKEWETYEDIQSDIFDHIVSIVPMFDLRIFQEPSSHSLKMGLKTERQ